MHLHVPRLLLLLALGLPAIAQAGHPGWKQFTNGDNVTDVALAQNAAWIATDVGLVRHDAATGAMRQFNTANSGLPHNYVNAVAVDGRGRVWAGTQRGVARWNGRSWAVWDTSSPGNPLGTWAADIVAMTCDPGGDLWIATRFGRVFQFDGSMWTVHDTADGIPRGVASPFGTDPLRVNDIASDGWGDIWLATNAGLVRWDWSSWTVLDTIDAGPGSREVLGVDIDEQGDVWAVAATAFARWDRASWQTFSNTGTPGFDAMHRFFDISVDPWGFAWIASNRGLVRFDGSGAVTWSPANSAIRREAVTIVETDDHGNTWAAGGYSYLPPSGIDRFDGSTWEAIATSNSDIPGNAVTQVEIARDRSVWTSASDRIARLRDGAWTVFDSSTSPLRGGGLIVADSDGGMWFASGDRLVRHAFGAWTAWDSTAGNPVRTVEGIDLDRAGAVWIRGSAATGPVLVRFDGASWRVFDSTDHPALAQNVAAIAFDAGNRAWLGVGSALLRYDGSTWASFGKTLPPVADRSPNPNAFIAAIAFDRNDIAWIGLTYPGTIRTPPGGLVRFDGTTWTLYDTANSGIGDTHVEQVRIAPDGAVWMVTKPAGHAYATPRRLVRFDGTAWTRYDVDDSGLPHRQIADFAFQPNGKLWIAAYRIMQLGAPTSAGGLASYRPATNP